MFTRTDNQGVCIDYKHPEISRMVLWSNESTQPT